MSSNEKRMLFIAMGCGALLALAALLTANASLINITGWLFIGSVCLYAFQKQSLTTWIIVSMFIGIKLGYDFPEFSSHLKVVSNIFLRLIKTVIAPLLFATLVVGIAGHSDLKQVGRLGWKSLVYFEIVTTIALLIGLVAINLTQAGVGIRLPVGAAHESLPNLPKQTWEDVLLHIFPENISKSIFEGHILQIVVFSILFGISLATLSEKRKKPMLKFCGSLAEVMFKFTSLVMYMAPFGVGAAIAYTVGKMGLGVLLPLFKLLATLYLSLSFFLLFALVPIAWFFRIPVLKFWKAISDSVTLAFATTSSESAMPKAMEALEKFGVPRKIVSFVLPLGYSFNLDGTTLYLSLASVFVAQAAGIQLSWSQQIFMVLTLMVTSKGVAGVPRASLIILLGTAASFGLPTEPIFLILGIDELMDMARTAVNVIGNCLATVVIARTEGELYLAEEGAT
jgi:proton glutamate symport protein